MHRSAALALLAILSAKPALAAPPVLAPLTLLPGDGRIAGAWGDQSDPDVAAGDGASLVVWSDARASEGRWDIYGIRVDDSGNPLEPVAFVIDQADGSQTNPVVAWNGQRWLVAWLDEGRLSATRVAVDGSVLDSPPVILGTPGAGASFAIASDGAAWALVWSGTSAGNADVRGARVASDGTVMEPGGVVILPETFFLRGQFALAFASDRYLLAWPEWTASALDDVLGITLTRELAPREPAPFVLASTPNADTAPALASDGAGLYLCWKEQDRNGWVNGISGTPVSADGVALQPEGVPLGDRRSWGESPDVAWDGSQWIVAWTALGVDALRIAADGTPVDAVPVTLASAADFNVRDVALAALGGGGAKAVFQDYRNGRENDIAGTSIEADGAAGAEGLLSLGWPSQQNAELVWNGAGWTIAFESHASDLSRILVQRLDASRAPIDDEPVEIASGDVVDPGIAWSGTRYLVTWRDREGSRVLARRLASDLSFQDAAPIEVMPGENPSVAALGDVFLVTFERTLATGEHREVFGQRIDGASGAPLGGTLNLRGGFAWASTLGTVGRSWLVAWEGHWAHDDTIHTLSLAFVNEDGTLGPSQGLVMGSGWGTSAPSVASHASTGGVAYSTTRAPSASNGEVHLVRVQADGALPDGPEGVLLTGGAPLEQFAPSVAWDGQRFVTAFQDTRANPGLFFFPRSDVYGARLGPDGTLLDDITGFAIENTEVPETQPAVAGARGEALVAASRLVGEDVGALRLGMRGLLADEPTAPPVGGLQVSRRGHLSWEAAGPGIVYDILRGSLGLLAANRSIADAECLADDHETAVLDEAEGPALAGGTYYLVRADASGVTAGTYDDPAPSQQARPRDADAGADSCTDLP